MFPEPLNEHMRLPVHITHDDQAHGLPVLNSDVPEPEKRPVGPPMIEDNVRVKVLSGHADVTGTILASDRQERTYRVLGDNGSRFTVPEGDVERLPQRTGLSGLPSLFIFDHWHDLADYQPQCVVEQALQSLMRSNGGKIPSELATEEHIMSFAGASFITLADADVEPALLFPQKKYASRPYVRDIYAKFLEFCLTTGWLTTDDIEIKQAAVKPASAERPRSSRVKPAPVQA